MVWRYLLLLFLIPAIYTVFGWQISGESLLWNRWIVERGEELNLIWPVQRLDLVMYGLATLLIIAIILGLTLLSEKMTVLLSRWFTTKTRSLVFFLGWSLAVVFILRWLGEFARFFILVSAIVLGRLELQEAGYNKLQIFLVLTLLCLGSFLGGVWAHSIWGNTPQKAMASMMYF